MELIASDQFLAWAKTLGIVRDPRYAPPECLVYEEERAATEARRWWDVPQQAQEVNRLLGHLLLGLGPWQTCYLWRRGGQWPRLDPPTNRLEETRQLVSMGPPVPEGFEGAMAYPRAELEQMLGRITAHVLDGWSVEDDLFLIPNDGQAIVQTDHHGVVRVSCLDQRTMNQLIKHMASGRYPLPTEPLDWTFKRPDWMA